MDQSHVLLSLQNYRLCSPRKGIAFILNNIIFYEGERRGSEIDLENMVHLFRELGYEIILREDLKGEVNFPKCGGLCDPL